MGRVVGEEEGEVVPLHPRMEQKGEVAAEEVPQEWKHGPVAEEVAMSPGWGEEVEEQPCPVGWEGEVGAQTQELWREEVEVGHRALGQEEGAEGQSRGEEVEEGGGRLWREEEEEGVLQTKHKQTVNNLQDLKSYVRECTAARETISVVAMTVFLLLLLFTVT